MARNYGNYLLLSGILKNVPTSNAILHKFSDYVLNPRVRVVSVDCLTQLGSVEPTGDGLIGKVELATDQVIDNNRVAELQEEGVYKVSIRTLDTCTSDKGVCQACYNASNLEDPVPNVGDVVTINPDSTNAFFSYLSDSYSGSLIGIRALPAGRLPIRKDLFDHAIADSYLSMAYRNLRQYASIPRDMMDYCDRVEDKLEKALLIIAMYSLFSSIKT